MVTAVMTATAAFAAADSKGKARTLGRRGGITSATSSATRSPQPQPPARWSWLRATACSSVVVVSLAYVHTEASRYLAVVPPTQPPSLPHTLSSSQQLMHFGLAAVVTVVWFVALVVSRRLRLHAPLQRLGNRVAGVADQLHALHATRALHHKHARLSQRRHSWGYFGVDRDVDDLDRLVVTSLSPERNVLPIAKSRRDSTQTEPDASSAARAADDAGATGRQIVLNPRGGARGGRHTSNQIVSDDPFVSRFHFQIQYDAMEKEYFLQDLGSTTGTFLFLKPHIPKRLHVTDRVKLGDTEFEVVAVGVNAVTGTPFLRLCFTDGPLAGVAQTIGKTAVTLGRRSSNALCITDDGSISGRHSVIAHLGDGFYITDLKSTNGTAVRLSASGEKSARRYLLHGDVFGVGSNRFLVEYSHQLDAQRGLQVPVHPHHD